MVDAGINSRGRVRLVPVAVAAAVLAPTLALLPVRLVPAVSAQAYPGSTTSHYVKSLSTAAAYNEGCATAGEATEPSSAVVILDFGPAARDITNGVTTYGALLWDAGRTYRTTAQIRDLARQFGRGFWFCSSPPNTDQLRLALGISSDSTMFDGPHGSAWGTMVDDVQAWFVSNGYASQVRADGAADIELGFNATYAMAKRWGDAFSAASDEFYYNFGDASGCSTTSSDNSTTACTGSWTQQQIWTVSWGIAAASAIPEIYSTTQRLTPNKRLATNNNALAWQQISLYGARFQKGRPIGFAGSLTQQQSSSDSGTDLAPDKGWAYLANAVSDDVRTSLNSLPWASDIKWGY